jgi:hypothetical protein
MNFNLFGNSHPDEDYSDIAEEILEEWLRQARQSHNVALTVIGTSAILAFAGVGLVYANKVQEGAITTAAGGVDNCCRHSVCQPKEEGITADDGAC